MHTLRRERRWTASTVWYPASFSFLMSAACDGDRSCQGEAALQKRAWPVATVQTHLDTEVAERVHGRMRGFDALYIVLLVHLPMHRRHASPLTSCSSSAAKQWTERAREHDGERDGSSVGAIPLRRRCGRLARHRCGSCCHHSRGRHRVDDAAVGGGRRSSLAGPCWFALGGLVESAARLQPYRRPKGLSSKMDRWPPAARHPPERPYNCTLQV